MPGTLEAIFIAAFAILPGALYTWAFEQQAGRWGSTATDRAQRFLGVSMIFLVLELPFLYWLYRDVVVSGLVQRGAPLPWWVWMAVLALTMVPIIAGQIVGHAVHDRKTWSKALTGHSPAPRGRTLRGLEARRRLPYPPAQRRHLAWRPLGRSRRTGLRSYAAGYPEAQGRGRVR